jgi:hypothetical protein
MDYALVEKLVGNGIFSLLFGALLVYVLRQNERRETRLMNILDKFSGLYEQLHKETCAIKDCLERLVKKGGSR